MKQHVVCRVEELQPGQRRIVQAGALSIGVFNICGHYWALLNRCPHKGAPLCLGEQTSYAVSDSPYSVQETRDGEIIRCPWHGWEFDLTSGRSVFNPHRVRVRTYEVRVAAAPPSPETDPDPVVPTFPAEARDGWVVLHLDGARRAR